MGFFALASGTFRFAVVWRFSVPMQADGRMGWVTPLLDKSPLVTTTKVDREFGRRALGKFRFQRH